MDKRQRQRELVWEERVRVWGRETEGAEERETRNASEYINQDFLKTSQHESKGEKIPFLDKKKKSQSYIVIFFYRE